MKQLLFALTLLVSIAAGNAQVSFTNNQGALALTIYVTNLPVATQAELESVFRQHNMFVTTNTASKNYTPSYLYTTNYVQTGVIDGVVVFSQVVTTNSTWTRNAVLQSIMDFNTPRVRANVSEIIADWIADRRERIAKERLKE